MNRKLKDQARAEIQALADANGGKVDADTVLAHAKNPDTACHHFFQWDIEKAAHEYRLLQARALIRSVKIEITQQTKTISAVAYVRDPDQPSDEQGYISVLKLKNDEELKREALIAEFKRAGSHLRRAREIAVVLDMENEIEVFMDSLSLLQQQVETQQ